MLLSLVLLATSAFAQFEELRDYSTPLRKLSPAEYPQFIDDQDMQGMESALQKQLTRFQSRNLTGKINMGGHRYPARLAKESLQVFLQLVGNFNSCVRTQPKFACQVQLNLEVQNRFDVFAPDLQPGDPRYGEPNDSLFTGYHTHLIEAKSRATGEFKYPIYAKPSGQAQFHTRGEIDFNGALKNRRLELAYTNSLFDIYLMHVQGGGYVTINENGSPRNFYLAYRATNGHRWAWISKYMLDKGDITNPSIAAQRKFLRLNPNRHEEIYSTNPSYLYYIKTTSAPVGSDSTPLTGGRSIATDSTLYGFKGLLTYIESERPVENGNYDLEEEDVNNIPFTPFSRFFLDQDTGGAIRGKGRADIYFGKTHYATFAASYQQKTGKLRYLILKDPAP